MRLGELVETSSGVAAVSGRLEKIARLADLLGRASAEDVPIAVAFLSGALPQGRIGLGWRLIAGARVVDAAPESAVTLADVNDTFARVQRAAGAGSTVEKTTLLRELFARTTAAEQDFLVRLLAGELRQGALEGVLIDAVARAAHLPAATVRRAAMMAGDLARVARTALTEGDLGLAQYSVQLLRPVQPMLADSAEDVDDAVSRLGDAAFEWKLDGARIQVHKAGDEVRVYSRTLREVTPSLPEVVAATRALPARELIVDGEVIALRADGSPHPFQVTMSRFGRRLDVARLEAELPLTPFFFDCLHLDGAALIDRPQRDRFAALREAAAALVVPHLVAGTRDQAAAFAADALARGHEGVMAKAPDAPYAAGRRGQTWLKIKVAKTLDLVVLAAEWGSGRRQGWLSNLHLGARDPEHHAFVMLGKTFKGLTDETLAWQTERLQALAIGTEGHVVHVRPELVVEIAFNDLQASPIYPGGLALRFARVKRYRPDKSADDADTFATVQAIHQQSIGGR